MRTRANTRAAGLKAAAWREDGGPSAMAARFRAALPLLRKEKVVEVDRHAAGSPACGAFPSMASPYHGGAASRAGRGETQVVIA